MRLKGSRLILISVSLFLTKAVFCPAETTTEFTGKTQENITITPANGAIDESFSNALAHYTMGVIYDNEGDTKKALQEYKKALLYAPDNALLHTRVGMDYFVLGDNDNAVKNFEKAKELDIEDLSPRFLLAIVYTSQAKYESAQKEYEYIIKKNPENLKAFFSLADLFILQEKLEEAAIAYETLIKAEPDLAIAHFNLGIIYTKLNKIENAIREIRRASELAPEHGETYLALGLLYEMKGDLVNAEAVYRKALKTETLRSQLQQRLAAVSYDLGNKKEAISQYEDLISRYPEDLENYIALSILYVKEEQFEKSIGILKNAEESGIETARLYAFLGYTHMAADKIEEAIFYYKKGIVLDTEDPLLHFYLGVAYDRGNDRPSAIAEFREAVKYKPDMHEAYNYLGYTFAEEGANLDEALELVKKALELDPENGAYIDSMGWIYYKKGMYEDALEYLKKAIEKEIDDPVILDHLGDVYYKLNAYDKSRAQWEKSLELNPEQEKVKEKLNKLGKE